MFSDLTAFFQGLDSVPALLNGHPVTGYVNSGFENGLLEGFDPRAGSTPRFTLQSAQVPNRPEGKPLVIQAGPAAGTYSVANAMHDGTGICELHLKPKS